MPGPAGQLQTGGHLQEERGEAAGQLRELYSQKTQNQVIKEASAACPYCRIHKSRLDKHFLLSQELSWYHTILTFILLSRE